MRGYDRAVSNHRLVYSSDGGDHRRRDETGRGRPSPKHPGLPNDGVVRVFREKGGRGGKTVTVVRGARGDLKDLAGSLKRHCATGGAVKDGAIEIQGDHRERIVAWLRTAGFDAKAAGG